MITATGYSKDKSIQPTGVVITFGQEMMQNNGGQMSVMKYFLKCINQEDGYWMQKMLLKPTFEISEVYIITLNRLWGKVNFGWYEEKAVFKYSPADPGVVEWPRMVLTGPFKKCPIKRELRGFNGFRYCTKLF